MSTLLVTNGVVVTGGEEPEVLRGCAVALGERVLAVGPEPALREAYRECPTLDAHGGLVMPGLINLHHHFYSALARGLDPGGAVGFPEVLERLWWRLDRALDPEAVLYASLVSLADSIRAGVTTVFDHHASPPCIKGILEAIAAAVQEAGLSALLCYEVSDRNGHGEARAGLEENLRFARERRADPRIRGALGLHASFTLSDETLRAAARLRPAELPVHVHAGEHPVDGEVSRARYHRGPIGRLDAAGLLGPRTLLAHGVHLEADELRAVARRRAVLVANPESNAHNGVGRLDVVRASALGCRVGLGTDGMSSSVLRSLRAAFLSVAAADGDASIALAAARELLAANSRVAAELFDEPLLGTLAVGAPADVVVVDAPPPTPLGAGNLAAHLVYGAAEAPVRHTVARGQVLMRDFQLVHLDLAALAHRAEALSRDVWRRFAALAPCGMPITEVVR